MKGGSSDSWVHGNWFEDVAGRGINAGGSTGLAFFRPIDAPYEAARLTIEANIFSRGGASSGAAIAFVGCDGCSFIHNTIIEPQTWVARILQETVDPRFVPSRNGVFANNIVVFDSADLRTFVNVGGNTAPETFVFASNLWFSRDQAGFTGPTLTDGIPPRPERSSRWTPRSMVKGDPATRSSGRPAPRRPPTTAGAAGTAHPASGPGCTTRARLNPWVHVSVVAPLGR
jgi:hypothetical protein